MKELEYEENIEKTIEKLCLSISEQMDAHLIESIVSLFNAGVLKHYVRTPRTNFDINNCHMSIEAASGVRFEGREKIIELERKTEQLENESKEVIINTFRRTHCSFNGEMYEDMTDEEILKWAYGE